MPDVNDRVAGRVHLEKNGIPMTPAPAQSIVVLGVGNTIQSDDGVGVHAARMLQDDPRLPYGVNVIDGGTLGLELLAHLHECTRLLLLDAVDIGKEPGTVVRLAGNELRDLSTGKSVHQLGVADLLNTLPLLSDIERKIVVLGVQPESTDWGTELSPIVEAAVASVLQKAIEELVLWTSESVGCAYA
jgi:hydrogenase maturation protease